jgi:hypothetical protein
MVGELPERNNCTVLRVNDPCPGRLLSHGLLPAGFSHHLEPATIAECCSGDCPRIGLWRAIWRVLGPCAVHDLLSLSAEVLAETGRRRHAMGIRLPGRWQVADPELLCCLPRCLGVQAGGHRSQKEIRLHAEEALHGPQGGFVAEPALHCADGALAETKSAGEVLLGHPSSSSFQFCTKNDTQVSSLSAAKRPMEIAVLSCAVLLYEFLDRCAGPGQAGGISGEPTPTLL